MNPLALAEYGHNVIGGQSRDLPTSKFPLTESSQAEAVIERHHPKPNQHSSHIVRIVRTDSAMQQPATARPLRLVKPLRIVSPAPQRCGWDLWSLAFTLSYEHSLILLMSAEKVRRGHEAAILTLATFAKRCIPMSFASAYAYTSEAHPMCILNSAVGSCVTTNSLGGAVAPALLLISEFSFS
eukprot:TsM_000490400 transcript=TsM_000490400 gene=TsM_000490400